MMVKIAILSHGLIHNTKVILSQLKYIHNRGSFCCYSQKL